MTRVQVALIVSLLVLVIVLEIRSAKRRPDDADWPEDDCPAATRGLSSGGGEPIEAPRKPRNRHPSKARRPAGTTDDSRTMGVARRPNGGTREGIPDGLFQLSGDARNAVYAQIKDVLDRTDPATGLRPLLAANLVHDERRGWLHFNGNAWVPADGKMIDERWRALAASEPDGVCQPESDQKRNESGSGRDRRADGQRRTRR